MKKKLIISISILCAITLLQGVVAAVLSGQIRRKNEGLVAASNLASAVSDTEIRHYVWLQNLTLTVFNDAEFTGSLDHEKCSLGNLLNSEEVKNNDDPLIDTALSKVYEPHRLMHAAAGEILSFIANGDAAAAVGTFNDSVLPNIEQTVSYLDEVVAQSNVIMNESEKEVSGIINFTLVALIVLVAVSVFGGVAIMIILIKQIVPPLQKLTSAAKEIALGDITPDYEVNSQDELGQLSQAFGNMIKGFQQQAEVLHEMSTGNYSVDMQPSSEKDLVGKAIVEIIDANNNMMQEIRSASGQVAQASTQIADGSQRLATGSTQQAATLQEFSATIAQIEEQAKDNHALAANTLDESKHASELMEESLEHMNSLNKAMEDINRSSDDIAKVINVIDNIAFQTNILALNAAVEAARAGQHGKGFAVVADEVRSLATKSQEAAQETAALIDRSIESVKRGAEFTARTGESLVKVGEISSSNAVAMTNMSEASQTQSEAIAEINQGISEISNVVHANSATAEQSAAAAEEMNEQSNVLAQIVGSFRLKEKKNAHKVAAHVVKERRMANALPEYSHSEELF